LGLFPSTSLASTLRSSFHFIFSSLYSLFPSLKSDKFAEELAERLRDIVPKLVYIPLSIDYLNDTKNKFVPKKDYVQNRLVTGALNVLLILMLNYLYI